MLPFLGLVYNSLELTVIHPNLQFTRRSNQKNLELYYTIIVIKSATLTLKVKCWQIFIAQLKLSDDGWHSAASEFFQLGNAKRDIHKRLQSILKGQLSNTMRGRE